MAHDHNGRVGPPRCEECNASIHSDERRSHSEFARSLCLDCQFALNPFLKQKIKINRIRKLSQVGRTCEPLSS